MHRGFGLRKLRSAFVPPYRLRWSRQGITERALKTQERDAFLLTLRRLAEQHELLPDRMMITGDFEVSDDIPASGGFGDVRSGTYRGGRVAVKTAKVADRRKLKEIRRVSIDGIFASAWSVLSTIPLQRFYREVTLWGTLSHPNVLELVGVQDDKKKEHLVTVSEWMVHGNIMDYIGTVKKNPANRLELVLDVFVFRTTPSTKIRR